MLIKAMRKILGEEKDLRNKLHSYYIYEANRDEQQRAKKQFEELLTNYTDKKFLALAPTKKTRTYIQDLLYLKTEPTWEKVIKKFFTGMIHLLEREIKKSKNILKPKNVVSKIKKELQNIHIYHKEDIVEITEKGSIIQVNYISKQHSPEHKKIFEAWRDTQLKFTINFAKNIFIWDYINVHASLRGKNIGTTLSLFCERLAKDLGITRFSVQYPNRDYWIKKMNYEIPYTYRIGSGVHTNYTLEGYKEL